MPSVRGASYTMCVRLSFSRRFERSLAAGCWGQKIWKPSALPVWHGFASTSSFFYASLASTRTYLSSRILFSFLNRGLCVLPPSRKHHFLRVCVFIFVFFLLIFCGGTRQRVRKNEA